MNLLSRLCQSVQGLWPQRWFGIVAATLLPRLSFHASVALARLAAMRGIRLLLPAREAFSSFLANATRVGGVAMLGLVLAAPAHAVDYHNVCVIASGNLRGGLAFDPAGNLYVSTAGSVLKLAPQSSGRYTFVGFVGDSTLGSETNGIALDTTSALAGAMYIANGGDGVRAVWAYGPRASPVPAANAFGRLTAGGNVAVDVALDSAGAIYVADRGNSAVHNLWPLQARLLRDPTVNRVMSRMTSSGKRLNRFAMRQILSVMSTSDI